MAKSQVATAVKNAFGTAGKTLDTTLQMVSVTIKGEDGKEKIIEKALHKSILATITQGMGQAVKLENFWRDNADAVVEDFFGADPFPNMTRDAMTAEFRASEQLDVMYAVFQQRHPEYSKAATLLGESQDDPKSDKAQTAADAYKTQIARIRTTANSQALRVVKYYVDTHCTDAVAEQREQETAVSLIEATIKDWANRATLKRGNFKLQAELDILNEGIDALREVVIQAKRARKATAPSSLLDLAVAGQDMHDKAKVGIKTAQRDRSVEKASGVVVMTPEQYAEASAS